MVRDFPQDPLGYVFQGLEFYLMRNCDKTKEAMQKAIELGVRDPRAYHTMALCLEDWPQAKMYFEKNINEYPTYGLSYIGLGRGYLLQEGNSDAALEYLLRGNELLRSYSSFAYLIQIFLMKGKEQDAMAILQEARLSIRGPQMLQSLENFFDKTKVVKLPIDIGI